MSPLNDHTTLFYNAFNKFDVTTLYQMLSPHCRMQNKYGNTARGIVLSEVMHPFSYSFFNPPHTYRCKW